MRFNKHLCKHYIWLCSYDTNIVVYIVQEEGKDYFPGCKECAQQGQDEEVVEEGPEDVEEQKQIKEKTIEKCV